ncbi:MAG: hypothetical protein QOF52_144 [Propionibacteriaceae bacterium]|jgi:glutamate synthase domain-containing protein 2|nr:hypothetical protein [Propionibacteriaceae bacterium]MDX6320286.1 hypothetical protein [Propionibacteriaceae bacterium]
MKHFIRKTSIGMATTVAVVSALLLGANDVANATPAAQLMGSPLCGVCHGG